MKLTERLTGRRSANPSPPSADEPAAGDAVATHPSEARVHITADAELVIDLRPAAVVGGPAATTDMVCPNCRSALRVDTIDAVSHHAVLSCVTCGFTFSPRLTVTPPR